MRQFVSGEFDELPVDPWDPTSVRERIMQRAHTMPADARIAVNLTGGTKLMFAGALAAARALGAVPYYINRRNRRVIFVDDFHSESLTPIDSVETILNLHGDGLTLSRAGDTNEFTPDRTFLTETLWKKSSTLAERYKDFLPYRNTTDPFHISAAGYTFSLDPNRVATVSGGGLKLRFENWPDYANYLTGGWFEEYVFLLLKPYEDAGVIRDLRLNMELDMNSLEGRQTRWKSTYNEFDVVFTDGYSLYIVECKAGTVTQEQVMKLQNLVRSYGGTGGRGIVASCFKPHATAEKKIADARLSAIYGKTLPVQLNELMETIAATKNSGEARA